MQRTWFQIGWPLVAGIVAAVVAVVVSGSQTNGKLNAVDRQLTLWDIQPGLGTVMIEYGTRFNNAWFAADAGNWDMVVYQLNEMTEIQEVGEKTRPARAEALKKFEDENVKALIAAAQSKDKAGFTDAYDKAISGCNKCHGEQKDAQGKDFRWIRIQRPSGPAPFSNVDWKGSGQ